MNLTINEILTATDGILLGKKNMSCETVTSVSTDSKKIKKGALFVPLHGEKVDSHKFISEAFSNGAVATFTDEQVEVDKDKIYIKVEDTLKALQSLAKYYRSKFNIPIVGITGSVGKTSTKEMISLCLSSRYNVLKTEGNLNGQVGLPLTIMNLNKSNDIGVIEMGISEFSEMERLSDIARPTYAVMTNIGLVHIENLKTQENILKEKFKITNNFDENSVLLINADDENLIKLKKNQKFKVITYGVNKDCDFRATNVKMTDEFTSFELKYKGKTENFTVPSVGIHNVYNALAGIALGLDLGINLNDLKKSLGEYKTLDKRQCIYKVELNGKNASVTLIDDSYNANPESMKNAVDVLNIYGKGKRKIAVLADMLELGEQSSKLHFELGKYVSKNNVDILIAIGPEAKNIAAGANALQNEHKMKVYSFLSNEEAFEILFDIVEDRDVILVKGSRGMHTDEIVKKFV